MMMQLSALSEYFPYNFDVKDLTGSLARVARQVERWSRKKWKTARRRMAWWEEETRSNSPPAHNSRKSESFSLLCSNAFSWRLNQVRGALIA